MDINMGKDKICGLQATKKIREIEEELKVQPKQAAAVTPAESPPAPEKGAAYVVPDGARLVEKVYGGAFADAIIKFHKPLIAIFLAIFVAATAIWTTTLVPATDALDFFDKQHVYTQHTKALREKFLTDRADEKPGNFLVAGVDEADPWEMDDGSHPACVEEGSDCVGSANYKGIDLCGHQQEFIDASQAYFEVIQAKGGAPHYETEHYNFMSDFKNYVEHEGSSFPYEPSDRDAFAAKLLEFRDSWDWPYGNMHDDAHGLRGDMTGFVLEGSVVKAAYAGFNTTLSRSDSFEELWDFYDAGESALNTHCARYGCAFAKPGYLVTNLKFEHEADMCCKGDCASMKLMKAWTGHNGHADHCYFDHAVVAARYPALLAADIAVAALKGAFSKGASHA